MDLKALMSLFIVASTLTTCMGQLALGSLVEGIGGLTGLFGGTGGSSGLLNVIGGLGTIVDTLSGASGVTNIIGGMGDLARLMGVTGQVTNIIGGMGELAGVIYGTGGIGGPGIVPPMIANTLATAKMDEVVKVALGPQASPNEQILIYANAQQRLPVNMAESVPYIEMMVELSKWTGIVMPDGMIRYPAPVNLVGYPGSTGAGLGMITGVPTLQDVRNLVYERFMMWLNVQ